MSFDARWRLNRRTFDPVELRNAVEEVARELGVARTEWRAGPGEESLQAHLWLPAALVRAYDYPGFSKKMVDVDVFPTQLAFWFDRGGPEPLDVSEFSLAQGETVFGMAFSEDPARSAGGIAVGSTLFLSRHASWQAHGGSSIPDTEDGYFRCVQRAKDGGFWIGAEDGTLYRYKRGEWTRFKVATEWIDAMCVVSPTRLFLSLENGDLLEFDGGKVVRRWPEMFIEQVVDTVEGPVLYGMQVLRRLEGGEWKTFRLPSDFDVFAIAGDRRRRLWLANKEAVFLSEGSQLIPTPVRCHYPESLAVHDENDIWVTGSEGKIVHWDGKALARADYEPSDQPSMMTDGRGRAWIFAGKMFEVSQSSAVTLSISSKRDANSEAWGALAEVCARVANRLDGYILDS